MKKFLYSETQIVSILNEAENGVPVSELCRTHGMSSAAFYQWGSKCEPDLPPEAPSFITRVCEFGLYILRFRFGQVRRARSPQIAQALDALQRVFCCPEMSVV